MLLSYLPVAQVRVASPTWSVPLKTIGFQKALQTFCPIENDNPVTYLGNATLYWETFPELGYGQVRVEVDGRTVGHLGQSDSDSYWKKMQQEGVAPGPLVVPIKIRGGSLVNQGPPFYFYAELLIPLNLQLPWDLEHFFKKDHPDSLEIATDGEGTAVLNPPQTGFGDFLNLGRGHPVFAEKFGRGLGVILLIVFVVLGFLLNQILLKLF